MQDGRFNDFAWHIGYPKRKKKKVADCLFLDNDRFCNNEKSMNYHSKCFEATNCPVRIKENDKNNEPVSKNTHFCNKSVLQSESSKRSDLIVKPIKCSIPQGSVVFHKKYGSGVFESYDSENGYIAIQFKQERIMFSYLLAFQCGTLTASDSIIELVQQDMDKST